ncbi:metal ABC transporter substrate-binding protein [Nocardioides jejuensis]|uniref:Zinc ABC transporter substrate-binding protein n=1 Tax=Nocardioides jejuensis TaxID=2502782 RepID=A0A4R1CBZ5_9ACTN|nr:metal ABC transporter substrate-binding protein [Nocardioides jejuensis]TCJ28037.1 zinc ABC transporter substrate-binding protein [Nocardioides jejuensis]
MFSFVLRLRPLAAAAIVAAAGLSACGPASSAGGDPKIVAAFYPLQYVAERVAGPGTTVENLTQPGKEPHDLELSVRQVADVNDADLLVYERGFQAAVDAAVDTRSGAKVDAAAVAGLQPVTPHPELAGTTSGEDEGSLDPHFWQDPTKLAKVADAIATELASSDPDHAADYRKRAAGVRRDLDALDKAYAQGLRTCARTTVVVSHDAFEYLGRYGIKVEPISGLSPEAEPTAADLAALQKLIRKDGITTVFSETLVSKAMAESLARDMGIRSEVLDPLEGLTAQAQKNGGDYLSVMRSNLAALQKANGC